MLWKKAIKHFVGNLNNLYTQDHDLTRYNMIYNLEKLNSRELYIEYRIPHIAAFETKICIFQYKLFNNVLYLNKKLFHFGIISQSKCSFCELHDEIPRYLFYECAYAQNLWNQLRLYLSENLVLTVLNPEFHFPLY